MDSHIKKLLQCIDLEEIEQSNRYRLDQSHSLKQLKSEGLALHPIRIIKKYFGYADYPEISFKINFPPEINMFRDGAAIECFLQGEDPIKGMLLNMDGKSGEFRLFAPDFPDWLEDDGVGIKLAPDTRTTTIMKKALTSIANEKKWIALFEKLHTQSHTIHQKIVKEEKIIFTNTSLNQSQQDAVKAVLENQELCILHGPPGTGKTTTLIESILQLINRGLKVVVTAPSNTAIDNISKGLIAEKVQLIRIGNIGKVDNEIFSHTPEGRMQNSPHQKEIKDLKRRADEFRRMAMKYKRSFGRDEREQRNLLLQEVKNIRAEIKRLEAYFEEKLYADAQVIAGTPIGLYDISFDYGTFDTLIMDEAGQCLEPLAWCVFPLAKRIVLAGDHLQLPPTVLSQEAIKSGFDTSVLEWAITNYPVNYLLNTQYRMRNSIAGFSSEYFYQNKLMTPDELSDLYTHITFIDTVGAGYNEKSGKDGTSLQNEGELDMVHPLIEQEHLDPMRTAFISPYSGQVFLARERLSNGIRISTIDSFQGQEMENVIISLVRSNDDGQIGFLKDYRRMNVAITRAKNRLYVIGDSATIGHDEFYKTFLDYVERKGEYRTVWEMGV